MPKPTYRIVSSGSPRGQTMANRIAAALKAGYDPAPAGKRPDYLLVSGGDGTFIRSAAENDFRGVKIVGVNAGNLGFYSSFGEDDIPNLPALLQKAKFAPISLLTVKHANKTYTGLNELAVSSSTAYPLDISFDGCFYERFRGTGVLVASRTGSTGYAKSAGGAVAFPGVECLEFIELYPLLHVGFITIQSPLALPPKTRVEISPAGGDASSPHPRVHLDGREIIASFAGGKLAVHSRRSNAKFCLPAALPAFMAKLKKTFVSDGQGR